MLNHESVRQTLRLADWVSLKVDSVLEKTWHKINRPHGWLRLDIMLQSMLRFASEYGGKLVTETMLVKGLNDTNAELNKIAEFLETLSPSTAYLSAPIRPPAESWVRPPGTKTFNRAYQILSGRLPQVELITTPEDNQFAFTSDLQNELLSTTAVHPLRQDAVNELVKKSGESWQTVEELVESGALIRLEYEGETFYIRRMK